MGLAHEILFWMIVVASAVQAISVGSRLLSGADNLLNRLLSGDNKDDDDFDDPSLWYIK
jgi:hypothetical protein